MKIIIETSESERVALQPQDQPMSRQGVGSSVIEMEAIDGGAPREELLQSLASRTSSQSSAMGDTRGDAYNMAMSGGEPSLSRH